MKIEGVINTLDTQIIPKSDHKEEETHVLIVKGFLLDTFDQCVDQCYFMTT